MNLRLPSALVLFLSAPLVAADDDALALIPPRATITVQVNGLGRVQERIEQLLTAAVPDRSVEISKAVRDAIGDALTGRDTNALRPDGRLLVGLADLDKLPDSATLTFLFPAKSADDFRARFLTGEERKSLKKDGDLEVVQWEDRKEPFYIVNLKDYVAVTSDRATATGYAKGEFGAVAKQLSADTSRTFLDADIGLFVNVREVNAKHANQLKTVKGLANLFLKGDTIQGVSRSQLDQMKGAVEAVFQVVEHGTAAVLAVQFRPDGLMVRGLAQFADNSATAASLKEYKSGPLPQLGTLPAGQMSYTIATLNPSTSTGAAAAVGNLAADDSDPTARQAIAGFQKSLAALDRGITISVSQLSGSTMELIESKDAAKMVDARVGILKALTKGGSFGGLPLKARPELAERADTVGAFTLHRARFTYDFDQMVADLPEDQRAGARDALRKSVGGDDQTVWIGTDGATVMHLVARDWEKAKALSDAYLTRAAPLEGDPAYQFTRKQLPADATMLVMLDAGQTAKSLTGSLRPAPKDAPAAEAVGKRAYIGVALVLKPGHGGFDVFVPAAAAEPVRRLVEPLIDDKK